MMRHDVPNHQRRKLLDLSFTRVIACRVGTSFSQAAKTGDFTRVRRDDVANHQRRQLVDSSFARVIPSRVGTSFSQAAKTGDLSRVRRDRPLSDVTASATESSFIRGFPVKNLREFTHKELRKATNNFSRELVIGRGGFGEVFRGTLADGTLVAIKVSSQNSSQDIETVKAELRVGHATSSGSHPGLVRVVGYHCSLKRWCDMIVYAFMANGDMGCFTDDRQLERTPLDWPTRKRIILGAARGLCRLHELGIVHRDVKPSNIMLDEDFEAHLGDFGLARSTILHRRGHDVAGFCRDDDSDHCDSTRICGTFGYMAPEVARCGHYSRKSDVYGFGVSLIQLVMGKPAIDRSKEGLDIGCRAERLFKNGEDLTRHMHPGMWGKYNKDEAIKLIRLGLICTEDDPKKRPLMPEVIAIIEGSVATMHQRWNDYEYHFINRLSSPTDNQSTGSGDVDETPNASDSDTDEEELRENNDGIILPLGNQELWSTTYNQFTGNGDGDEMPNASDSDTEEEEPRENDDGTILPLGNQRVRRNAEVETELSEMRDRMRVMEAEMEEMRQKQIMFMQSMAMMRERHTQQVNEMQAEIDHG